MDSVILGSPGEKSGKDRPGGSGGRKIRPLAVHVGLAMAGYAYAKNEMKAEPSRLEAMLEGIRKYQDHPFRREVPLLPEIWRAGEASVRLCRAGAGAENGQGVLLVPSMINRSAILDLLPGRSLARWLAARGFDVYIFDWGTPADDEGLESVESVIGRRLVPAMAFLSARTGRPYHALGYCMGGTLLAAAASRFGKELCSLSFLASPWDFHAGDRALADGVSMGAPSALGMIDSDGRLPVDWIQSVFAAVNAGRALEKFAAFAKMEQDGDEARLFVAVEDWLNDGLDLPSGVARACILEWYGENRPARGSWTVGGRRVDPSAFADKPVLLVTPSGDRLVPPDSAEALGKGLSRATVLRPGCGHIGMMTGRRAAEDVWAPLASWLAGHGGA